MENTTKNKYRYFESNNSQNEDLDYEVIGGEILRIVAAEIEHGFTLEGTDYLVLDNEAKKVYAVGWDHHNYETFDFGTKVKDVSEACGDSDFGEDEDQEIQDYMNGFTDELIRYWDGSNWQVIWLGDDYSEIEPDSDLEIIESKSYNDRTISLATSKIDGELKYFYIVDTYYQGDVFGSVYEVTKEVSKKIKKDLQG
jgi:hypothetical protein